MPIRLSELSSLGPLYADKATHGHLHVASIYVRGILVARATNRPGTRTSGAGFSTHSLHAERAVLKMVDFCLLRDAELVVVRINKRGGILPSKPCHSCQCALTATMKKWGLRRVYYS